MPLLGNVMPSKVEVGHRAAVVAPFAAHSGYSASAVALQAAFRPLAGAMHSHQHALSLLGEIVGSSLPTILPERKELRPTGAVAYPCLVGAGGRNELNWHLSRINA